MKATWLCIREKRLHIFCFCLIRVNPKRPKARGLAQHGGPPGWLEDSDPGGVILNVMEWPYRLTFPYRTGCPDRCPAASWWNFQLVLFSKCTQPSWAMSRKKGLACYSVVDPCLLSGSTSPPLPQQLSQHLSYLSLSLFLMGSARTDEDEIGAYTMRRQKQVWVSFSTTYMPSIKQSFNKREFNLFTWTLYIVLHVFHKMLESWIKRQKLKKTICNTYLVLQICMYNRDNSDKSLRWKRRVGDSMTLTQLSSQTGFSML
jgi:hypothetical protein